MIDDVVVATVEAGSVETGKSLLISTLEAYFQGKKDLFRGLAMEEIEKLLNTLTGANAVLLSYANSKIEGISLSSGMTQ